MQQDDVKGVGISNAILKLVSCLKLFSLLLSHVLLFCIG